VKIFQPLTLPLQRANATLGQRLYFQATQDSIIEEFLIMVEGTISTAAATATVEGLPALVQQVLVQGTLTGYSPPVPCNNMSGPMLSEYAQFKRANVSYSFGSLGSTGAFAVSIPVTFSHWRWPAPFRFASCLPAKWMGALNVNVTMAIQSQVDTDSSPTFAVSALSVYIQQNQFKSDTVPNVLSPLVPAAQVPANSFQYIPSTLNYQSVLIPQAGPTQQQLFPNGTYLNVMVRSFTSTNSTTRVPTERQADGTAGPIDTSVSSPGLVLQDVNQAPRRAADWYSIRKDNLDHIYDSLVDGNACFQMNRNLSDVFQPQIGPNQIPLLYPVVLTGTSNPRIDFVYEQLFDSTNWLGLI
jgi:hypothetical protein